MGVATGQDRRRAYGRLARRTSVRDWVLAFDQLRKAGDLGPEDTMALATAAYLSGMLTRPSGLCRPDTKTGSGTGIRLAPRASPSGSACVLNVRGEMAVGGGWVARAQRLLETETEDVVERGYLLVHEFFQHLSRGDFARAAETAARVLETGRRFTEHDLIAQGLMAQGRMMIYSGRVPEGLALLDEAMVGISAGEVSPIIAGMVVLLDDRGVPGAVRLLARGLVDHCLDHDGAMRSPGWFRTPVNARCIGARSCGCVGPTTRRSLNLPSPSAGTRRRVRRHRPDGRWPSRATCCASAASSTRRRRRTGRQPSSATSRNQDWRWPGWLAVGRQRRSRRSADCSPRRTARCTGPGCFPPPWRSWFRHDLLDEARQNSDELSGIASAFGNSALRAMATYAAATVASGLRRDGGRAQQCARVVSPLERHRVAVRGCAGPGPGRAGSARAR